MESKAAELKLAVKALAALAQGTRLAIYRLLVQQGAGGLAAGELASHLAIAPATLSFHLKELSNAGLVQSRQSGRFVFYSADFEQMRALLAFLARNCGGGETRNFVEPSPAAKRKSPAQLENTDPGSLE